METRTTTRTVTFKRPFSLPGADDIWPAGDYLVTTDEEQLDTSFAAYRRIATTIALRKGPITTYAAISPDDLAAALARDAAGQG